MKKETKKRKKEKINVTSRRFFYVVYDVFLHYIECALILIVFEIRHIPSSSIVMISMVR